MTASLRLAALVLLSAPALASAEIVWKGDFETGNTSQFTRSQSVANSRLQVVTDVVREGRYALKATVRQGDDPIGASGNRNELLYISEEKAGSTYFYKWSTMFPSNYPISDGWQVFTQWHQEGCCGSPPLEFFVRGQTIHMRVGGADGPIPWTTPLARGTWHDFVLQVKWSSNPKVGFVQLWHNGKLVLPKTMGATQFGSEMNYMKLGLYREDTIRPEASVYHDGFTMATSQDDVIPPVTTPTPTPTPTPETPTTETPTPETPTTETPTTETPTTETPTPETPTTTPPVITVPTLPGPNTPSTGVVNDDNRGGSGGGCSASGAGGTPFLAATGLLALATLLGRRRRYARAHAPRR
ncbi:polysaccharide lyase [Myxococcus sp. K15C18031901]|uniref:polysaccharide lyase n=1 Tax=Myxococcus dinghuensis TaxID=2906761 RepID=UPI0020A76500|nr:polysaccharide lyase [Myxococcus dinghuensis]MCP3104461.1 polysaccharide lyase [Myxococcus dinghuensis]